MSIILAAMIALPRIIMGILFVAAALTLFPRNNSGCNMANNPGLLPLGADPCLLEDWQTLAIDRPAWLFEGASWMYLVACFIDFGNKFNTGDVNMVSTFIFVSYVAAGVCVLVGAIWLLEDVRQDAKNDNVGQKCFIAAGSLMLFAVCCDISTYLAAGKKMTFSEIVAYMAVIPGASLFLIASTVVFPIYATRPEDLIGSLLGAQAGFPLGFTASIPGKTSMDNAASLFLSAGVCFCIHAFAYMFAVAGQLSGGDDEIGEGGHGEPAKEGNYEDAVEPEDDIYVETEEKAPLVEEA